MGTSTAAADKDAYLITAPSQSGESLRAQVRSLSPTSNYTKRFYLEGIGAPGASMWGYGLCLYDSTSGRFVVFIISYNSGNNSSDWIMKAQKWNSATSNNSDYKITAMSLVGPIPKWMQIRDDGTNRYLDYSINGVDWVNFHTVGRTDWLTPNNIGFVALNNGSGSNCYVRLRSFA